MNKSQAWHGQHPFLLALVCCVTVVAFPSLLPAQDVSWAPKLEDCELAPAGQPPLPPPVLCGWYPVPEDRGKPDGRWIRLRVVVVKSTIANPEPDPVVNLYGGPGQPAASFAPYVGNGHRERFPRRDLVLVDQRGTGDSNGLFCPSDIVDDRPVEQMVAHIADPEALRNCRKALGAQADLSMYHTSIAAVDLAEILDWLGYERVNLYGGSYGTRMAQVFMRMYPEKVRTATLDGAVTMDAFSPGSYSADATDALSRLIGLCESDSACAAAYPSLRQEAKAALDRLDGGGVRTTVVDPRDESEVPVELSRLAVGYAIRGMLYSGNQFPLLPSLIHQAYANGDYSGLAQRFVERALSFSGRTFSTGMYYSVFCAEDIPFITDAQVKRSKGTLMGDVMIREYRTACHGWPRGEIPQGFHDPVTVKVPTLILSGEFDPSTPSRDGEKVAAALPNVLHLLIKGGGHGWASNPNAMSCLDGVLKGFVQRGTLDGLDTRCVGEIRPPAFVLEPPPGPTLQSEG